MNVLVAYATAHGSTAGVAGRIGEALAATGCTVDVRPVEQVGAVESYDAVVLGSAVHDTTWLPAARSFARRQRAVLRQRPVWLFSVSTVGDSGTLLSPRVATALRTIKDEPKHVARIRTGVRARGHRNFAGALDRSHWHLKDHLLFRATGGRYGDHRDWADIDRWAGTIADALEAAPKAAPV